MKLTPRIDNPFNPVLTAPPSFDKKDSDNVKTKREDDTTSVSSYRRRKSTTRHKLYTKTLHVSVPQKLIDDLFTIAEFNSLSIPAVVRAILTKHINEMK